MHYVLRRGIVLHIAHMVRNDPRIARDRMLYRCSLIAPSSRTKQNKITISIFTPIFPACSPRLSEEELPSAWRVNTSKHSDVIRNGNSKRFAEIIAATAGHP